MGIQGWRAATRGRQPEEDALPASAAAASSSSWSSSSQFCAPLLAWWQLPAVPVWTFSRGHFSAAALPDLSQGPSASLQVCTQMGWDSISTTASRVASGVLEPQPDGGRPDTFQGFTCVSELDMASPNHQGRGRL